MFEKDLDVLHCIKRSPPFSELPDDAQAELAANSRIKSYLPKEIVFAEGESGDCGYCIASGRLAMVKTSPNGREMIMELLSSGELFGVIALLDNKPYPLTARALSEASVVAIRRSVISALSTKHPEIIQGMLRIVADRLQSAHNISRALAHDKVEVRIASSVFALIREPLNNGAADVEIGRQELADLTGTTIETASRVCKALERDGIVDLSCAGLIRVVEPERLRAIGFET